MSQQQDQEKSQEPIIEEQEITIAFWREEFAKEAKEALDELPEHISSIISFGEDIITVEVTAISQLDELYEHLNDESRKGERSLRKVRLGVKKELETLTLLGQEFKESDVPKLECFAYPEGYGSGASGIDEYESVDELTTRCPQYPTDSVHTVVLEENEEGTYIITKAGRVDNTEPDSQNNTYSLKE